MKLTLIQTGDPPPPLDTRYDEYATMFEQMFARQRARFDYETVRVNIGEALPRPADVEAALITGSPAGVYDDLDWLEPLRGFVRDLHDRRTPLVGVCFGHQIVADALGGTVTKSDKGWGMGRHSYRVAARPGFMKDAPETLAVACSHQDQVIAPPEGAEVILASEFTPYAGLLYDTGATFTVQPHPEFADDYMIALAENRRGRIAPETVDTAIASFAAPSDADLLARYLTRFLETAKA